MDNEYFNSLVLPLEEEFGLTKRGTPRQRRPMRSRKDVVGDLKAEENMYQVKLGARCAREDRDDFVAICKAMGVPQGRVLSKFIKDFNKHYESFLETPEIPKTPDVYTYPITISFDNI